MQGNGSSVLQKVLDQVETGKVNPVEALSLIGTVLNTTIQQQEQLSAQLVQVQASLQQLVESQKQLTTLITEVQQETKENPSLVWLLKNKPKETIATIVAIFVLLSLWFIGPLRDPILHFLGLGGLVP